MAKVIGFSGSAVKNGVLEKAMKKVLESTGQEWELVRIADLDMKYCTGCTACAKIDRCVLKDDINEMLEKVLKADAVVFGGVARFGRLNSLTKAFFERLFAFFHNDVIEGKLAASVSGGVFNQKNVEDEISGILGTLKMREVGSLRIDGNASCYKCGKGETCPKSVFRMKFGEDAKISPDVFYRFENDSDAIDSAKELGVKISDAIAATK